MKRQRREIVSDGKGGGHFTRNFDHVDGNWPSHVYLDGQYQILDPIAHACVERVQNKGVRDSKIIPTADPHISASRPFVLRSHQIISFVTHVGKLIGHMNELTVRVESKYKILANDSNTRHFIALLVTERSGKLLEIVRCVDEALALFAQPSYFSNPIFHISVASMLPSDDSTAAPDPTVVHPVSLPAGDQDQRHTWHDDDSPSEDAPTPDWMQQLTCYATESSSSSSSAAITGHSAGSDGPQTVTGAGGVGMDSSGAATAGLGDLLAGYSSESDDDSGNKNIISSDSKAKSTTSAMPLAAASTLPKAEQGIASRVVTLTAVVCQIGNRVFRLQLRPLHEVSGGGSNSSKSCRTSTLYGNFVEVTSAVRDFKAKF